MASIRNGRWLCTERKAARKASMCAVVSKRRRRVWQHGRRAMQAGRALGSIPTSRKRYGARKSSNRHRTMRYGASKVGAYDLVVAGRGPCERVSQISLVLERR